MLEKFCLLPVRTRYYLHMKKNIINPMLFAEFHHILCFFVVGERPIFIYSPVVLIAVFSETTDQIFVLLSTMMYLFCWSFQWCSLDEELCFFFFF